MSAEANSVMTKTKSQKITSAAKMPKPLIVGVSAKPAATKQKMVVAVVTSKAPPAQR